MSDLTRNLARHCRARKGYTIRYGWTTRPVWDLYFGEEWLGGWRTVREAARARGRHARGKLK